MTTSKTRWHHGVRAMPLFAFVTIQALIIVVVQLHRTLWTDEFNLLITVRRPLAEGLLQLQDYSAPLYQLMLRPFVANDAPPEWLVRAPAFAASLASVVAAWYFVNALFSRRAAVIALLFVVLDPVFALYSVEARPYTLFTFFATASMTAFYSLIKGQPASWKLLAAYVLTSILLVYAHYYGFLVIAAQVAFAAVEIAGTRDRKTVRRMAWAFGAIGVATLPAVWLVSRYVATGAPGAVGWIKRPQRTDLLFLRQAGTLLGDELLCVVCLLAVVVALRSGESDDRQMIGTSSWWTWWCRRRAAMLCLLWIVFGLYLPVLVSYAVRPIYVMRYGLPVVVPLAALLGAALCRVRKPWLPLTVGALLTLPASRLPYFLHEDQRYYDRLIATLRAEKAESLFVGDLPYCQDFRNMEAYGLRYYGFEGGQSLLPMVRKPNGQVEPRDGDVLPRDQRVFVVTAVGAPATEEYVQSEGRAHRRLEFGNLTLLEIERAGARAGWLRGGRRTD